jgi:signal transduction histidine kinase
MSASGRILRAEVDAGPWSRVTSAYSRWPVIGHVLQGLLLVVVWMLVILISLQLRWYPADVGDYEALGILAGLAVAVCRFAPLPGLLLVGVLTSWPPWYFEVTELRVIPIVIAAFLSTAAGARLLVVVPSTVVFVVLTNLPSWVWSEDPPLLESLSNFFQYMEDPSTRVLSALVVAGAVLLGYAVRVQRRNVETLRERNAELMRLRAADIARIAAEERTTLARDIHDVVAHHVSAMVIRAQAADRVADSRPEELRTAVRWIAGDGQEALAAMRQVVRVLRGDSDAAAPLTPADFASSIDEIVRRVRTTGLEVNEAIAPGLELSAMLQSTVVRIVQEALTNVMLHSDASSVRISLAPREESIELRIDDDGSDDPRPVVSASGGGSGIRGMRERAEAAGGSLVSGRVTARGWTILARLPAGAGVLLPHRETVI